MSMKLVKQTCNYFETFRHIFYENHRRIFRCGCLLTSKLQEYSKYEQLTSDVHYIFNTSFGFIYCFNNHTGMT